MWGERREHKNESMIEKRDESITNAGREKDFYTTKGSTVKGLEDLQWRSIKLKTLDKI